jgi:hypothetical protein
MRRRRVPARWLVAILAIALLAAAALALAGRNPPADLPPRPEARQPALMLLSSLPLIFPESFGLGGGGSRTLGALESRYRVEPIGVADAHSLAGGNLLLMAHPLAQPAEALVDLDRWVRDGGRVLILADPKLDRPSALPLGHIHRPPPYFADTGLLGHWGLRLDGPEGPGPAERTVGGRTIRLSSPGRLSGSCESAGEGLVARCAVGKGKATIIADADLLQPPGASPAEIESNLQFLLAELARLER